MSISSVSSVQATHAAAPPASPPKPAKSQPPKDTVHLSQAAVKHLKDGDGD